MTQNNIPSAPGGIWQVTFASLPATLDEFRAAPMSALNEPQHTAALTVAALCAYPKNKTAALDMLNYLKGPQPLSPYETQFLADRLRGKDYVPASFFMGSTPENNYTPNEPYVINIIETPHSRAQLSEGYLQLYIQSGGADSPRPIKLRYKSSTNQWFLWEQMLLSDIRPPAASDPWS